MSSMKYTVDGDLIPADMRITDVERRVSHDRAVQSKQLDSIQNRLSIVEDMLCILNRDLDYEDKYPELRKAYNRYNTILEKYKTFNILSEDGS